MTRTHDKSRTREQMYRRMQPKPYQRYKVSRLRMFPLRYHKERVNVQIEKFVPDFKLLRRCVYIQD